uniref:RING-type domain-containing protein n=1 Tax=Noctiluca scintillans TaxID=2966 RepID=A0A7S1FHW6_NOCSC|mmetsp:Transcript_62482/g.165809  ORF Transcript_62482/g.165809 Transcript_62482/m.165809 type:complete len:264 (+) Transcript_62482:76-867(+)
MRRSGSRSRSTSPRGRIRPLPRRSVTNTYLRMGLALDGEGPVCGICFEPVEGCPVLLPCACRADYCGTCWDRALASSMILRGTASCPSCRATVRVDFDAGACQLRFSLTSTTPLFDDTRSRLYEQARPAQIQLLRSYGVAANDDHRTSDDGAPKCVCGSQLTCLSLRERVFRYVAEVGRLRRTRVEELIAAPPIRCDLCNGRVGANGSVWTCENGRRTVLHAASYDVCESCFEYYTESLCEGVSSWRARVRGAAECVIAPLHH